jgi:hypothetical protein
LSVSNLAEIRAKRRAASVATAVLADLAIIQDRLIGYFHVDAGNPATDVELGAAGLLCALAEQLEQAVCRLRDCEVSPFCSHARSTFCGDEPIVEVRAGHRPEGQIGKRFR